MWKIPFLLPAPLSGDMLEVPAIRIGRDRGVRRTQITAPPRSSVRVPRSTVVCPPGPSPSHLPSHVPYIQVIMACHVMACLARHQESWEIEAFLRRPSDSPRVSRCSEPRSTASWIRRGVLSSSLGPHEGKFPTTPKDVPESQAAKRTPAELPLPFPAGSPRWRGAMSPSTIASSHTLSINWVLAPVCHQTHRGARRGTLASDSPVSVSFRFGGEHRTLGNRPRDWS
ncbi:hypothetical protein BGZ61DRAFT_574244 [Ilyonectria robusta]|uniref:uncharacterized protein n=1 Tax=Ilyonectria robusta TaxID=1079257 RepID=UPI001E8CD0AB|nr:uncharacterized protein BGZ61DRAFT_574244 [Ilyonectria robusta]KAH8714362.1 hypothetical protein BGZ61DRAFT_574244 [Ilyonectria robusta]